MIRCIALDLDRTTLNSKGTLSDLNKTAIESAIKQGVHVVIASGRAFDTLPKDVMSIEGIDYAVTSNGAAVYRVLDGVCLKRYHLNSKNVVDIIEILKDEQITYEAFIDGKAYAARDFIENPMKYGASQGAVEYVRKTRNLVENIEGFILDHAEELESMDIVVSQQSLKEKLWNKIAEAAKDVYITSSVASLIEISDQHAGKHSGLRYVTELLGITPQDVAAFGDGDNDIDMLRFAGIGCAVANASKRCKQTADRVVGHHNEDGVGKAILELLK